MFDKQWKFIGISVQKKRSQNKEKERKNRMKREKSINKSKQHQMRTNQLLFFALYETIIITNNNKNTANDNQQYAINCLRIRYLCLLRCEWVDCMSVCGELRSVVACFMFNRVKPPSEHETHIKRKIYKKKKRKENRKKIVVKTNHDQRIDHPVLSKNWRKTIYLFIRRTFFHSFIRSSRLFVYYPM